ncbi:predicted protein [Nematostella vectensis]|uniref:Uncharacterized protein n=1 Tax=Nematostella vectensis TaxID=45351 RepID=A7RWM7_NEMVE|nr:predicted protein [Nematostella vectensis]|eukprot:XP_001636255.1 predicted protein [Nematostella vectensis]
MDKDKYIQEALRQLGEQEVYKETKDLTQYRVRKLSADRFIDDKTLDYLIINGTAIGTSVAKEIIHSSPGYDSRFVGREDDRVRRIPRDDPLKDRRKGECRYTFNIPNDVSSVPFKSTPQGTHLAAVPGPHMTITLIDVGEDPQIIALLGGQYDWVMDVACSSDWAMLTSGSCDQTVRVLSCATLKKARFHSGVLECDVLSRRKITKQRLTSSLTTNYYITLLNNDLPEVKRPLKYSDDGMWFASASDDFKIKQQHKYTYNFSDEGEVLEEVMKLSPQPKQTAQETSKGGVGATPWFKLLLGWSSPNYFAARRLQRYDALSYWWNNSWSQREGFPEGKYHDKTFVSITILLDY